MRDGDILRLIAGLLAFILFGVAALDGAAFVKPRTIIITRG